MRVERCEKHIIRPPTDRAKEGLSYGLGHCWQLCLWWLEAWWCLLFWLAQPGLQGAGDVWWCLCPLVLGTQAGSHGFRQMGAPPLSPFSFSSGGTNDFIGVRLVSWGISRFGLGKKATRVKVFLMCMMRRLSMTSRWTCHLAMTSVGVGLLRRGAMTLWATPLSHLSSQFLVLLPQLFDLLKQWLHTMLVFFLLYFHSSLPSLELVNHSGWLGCVRRIGYCASMLFVLFSHRWHQCCCTIKTNCFV